MSNTEKNYKQEQVNKIIDFLHRIELIKKDANISDYLINDVMSIRKTALKYGLTDDINDDTYDVIMEELRK